MNNEILKLTKKPELFKRSDLSIWTEEHLSKGMLEMHLDQNTELASRNQETIEKTINWIDSIIKPNSKILDLGCGPGLYTSKLSKLGHIVTGIDFSSNSLEYAKKHDDKTNYICMNYLEIDFKEEFDLITIIYCDYAALTLKERECLLKKIKKALKPNGLFIFDVFSINSDKEQIEINTWTRLEKGYWSINPHILLESRYHYDNYVSVTQFIVLEENSTKEYLVWNTSYTPEIIKDELENNDFEITSFYSNTFGELYEETSPTICIVSQIK